MIPFKATIREFNTTCEVVTCPTCSYLNRLKDNKETAEFREISDSTYYRVNDKFTVLKHELVLHKRERTLTKKVL